MTEAPESLCLQKNLAALSAGGQTVAARWLTEADGWEATCTTAQNGDLVLMVSGQSQASRHDPRKEAFDWLERQRSSYNLSGAEGLCLFGCGNPWIVELLLAERPLLALFEPNPNVLKSVFSRHDFSEALRDRLTILTPWHAADGLPAAWERALLLVHPPAQRREGAQLVGLRKAMRGDRPDLSHLSGPLKIMVLPPLSGGSWPVAVSLARAVTECGHQLRFMDWAPRLKEMEGAAHRAQGAEKNKLVSAIFEAALNEVSGALDFQPDLIISLAQAPLDAGSLARLKEKTQALAAFWLVEDFRNFEYVAKIAASYDAFFHIQEGLVEPALKAWGLARAWYLPMAADTGLFQPLPPGAPNSYRADLSFMGAGYPNRRNLMGMLAERYWPQTGRPASDFRIFGSGWNGVSRAVKRHLYERGRRVTLPECVMIYAGGLVNLNIHSSFRSDPPLSPESRFVNPRTFEIAAAASFQVVDSRPLLAPLFESGRELAVVERAEDLPEIINHYLAHPDEAAEIGLAARARTLREHAYPHRLRRMLNILGYAARA